MKVEYELRFQFELGDERLVSPFHLSDQLEPGIGDCLKLRSHAARSIDDKTHADRNLLARHVIDLLFDLILKDAEIVFDQGKDRVVVLINDSHVEEYQLGLELDRVLRAFLRLIVGLRSLSNGPRLLVGFLLRLLWLLRWLLARLSCGWPRRVLSVNRLKKDRSRQQ